MSIAEICFLLVPTRTSHKIIAVNDIKFVHFITTLRVETGLVQIYGSFLEFELGVWCSISHHHYVVYYLQRTDFVSVWVVRAPGESLEAGERGYIEVDSSPYLLAGRYCEYFELRRGSPYTSFQLLLVRKHRYLINRAIGPEPEEVFPNRQTSKEGFSIKIAKDVHISKIIKMFSQFNFRFLLLMTLRAWIVIMDNIPIKPMFIINMINSMFIESLVGEVKIFCRNYILVGIDYCYIYLLCSHFWNWVVCLYFESKIIVVLSYWQEGFREDSIHCEIVFGCNW